MARLERSRLEVWQQFLRAHRRVLGVLGDELEQERGLPLAWYEVLLHLERAPGRRLRMGDLKRPDASRQIVGAAAQRSSSSSVNATKSACSA